MAAVEDIITHFMSLLGQIKVYHWTTRVYAHHKALDDVHTKLSELVDTFVEAYIGKTNALVGANGKPKKFSVSTRANSEATRAQAYLESERVKIEELKAQLASHSELVNILEEIIGALDQGIYLLRLT